eukprot:GHVR01106634.1.p1 GENE.GHVR01106634.1~~GHVR01106634.1.p1  ORF type:complete len:900 (+),score=219.63 GHVR01106634.1:46-2745(+)
MKIICVFISCVIRVIGQEPEKLDGYVHIPDEVRSFMEITDDQYLDETLYSRQSYLQNCVDTDRRHKTLVDRDCEVFAFDGNFIVCGDAVVSDLLFVATSLEVKPMNWLPSKCIISSSGGNVVTGDLHVKGTFVVSGQFDVGGSLIVGSDLTLDMAALLRVGTEHLGISTSGCSEGSDSLGKVEVSGQLGLDNASRFVAYGSVEARVVLVDDFSHMFSVCGHLKADSPGSIGVLVTDGSMLSFGGRKCSSMSNLRVENSATAEFIDSVECQQGVEVLSGSATRVGGSIHAYHMTEKGAADVIVGGNVTCWQQMGLSSTSLIQVNGQVESVVIRLSGKSSARAGTGVISVDGLLVEGHSVLEVWHGSLSVGGHIHVEQTSSVVVEGTVFARGDIVIKTSMLLVGKNLHLLGRLLLSASSDVQVAGSLLTGLDGRSLPTVTLTETPPDKIKQEVSVASVDEADGLNVSNPGTYKAAGLRRMQIDIQAPSNSTDYTALGLSGDTFRGFKSAAEIDRETLQSSRFASVSGFKDEAEALMPKTRDEIMEQYFDEANRWGQQLPAFAANSEFMNNRNMSEVVTEVMNSRGIVLDMSSVLTVQGNVTARDIIAIHDGSAMVVKGGIGLFRGRLVVQTRSALNVTEVVELIGMKEAALTVIDRSIVTVGKEVRAAFVEVSQRSSLFCLSSVFTLGSTKLYGRSSLYAGGAVLVKGSILTVKEGSRLVALAVGVEAGDVYVDDGSLIISTKGDVIAGRNVVVQDRGVVQSAKDIAAIEDSLLCENGGSMRAAGELKSNRAVSTGDSEGTMHRTPDSVMTGLSRFEPEIKLQEMVRPRAVDMLPPPEDNKPKISKPPPTGKSKPSVESKPSVQSKPSVPPPVGIDVLDALGDMSFGKLNKESTKRLRVKN